MQLLDLVGENQVQELYSGVFITAKQAESVERGKDRIAERARTVIRKINDKLREDEMNFMRHRSLEKVEQKYKHLWRMKKSPKLVVRLKKSPFSKCSVYAKNAVQKLKVNMCATPVRNNQKMRRLSKSPKSVLATSSRAYKMKTKIWFKSNSSHHYKKVLYNNSYNKSIG